MRNIFTLLLLLAIGSLSLKQVQATHIAGADLTFECVGQDSFDITLTMYRDCSGIPLSGNTRTVDISSSCFADFSATLQLLNPGGTEVSQLCPDSLGLSQCVNGSNPYPGMEEFIFTGTVAMPSQCADIIISFDENARNTAVNANINSGTTEFYIETELNTVLFPCNTSPEFTSPPIPYVCQGQNVNYNYGIVEQDGDSLVFSLVNALTLDLFNNPVSVPYNAGFSGASPIPGITVNSSTGELNFTPNQTGKFIVVLEIDEYNGIGQLISRTRRDIQFVVINCNNQVPQAPIGFSNFSGSADSLDPTTIEAEVGENFCIDIAFTDPNAGDVLTLQSNVLTALPGATFSVNGTNPATATVCWTAFAGTNTNNVFNITANDSACPVSGQNSQAFNVIVPQVPTVDGALTTTPVSCNGVCDGTATLNIQSGIGPFNVIWAPGNFGNVTSVTGLCPNAYNVIVQDLGDPDPATNNWDTTFVISPANPITTFISGSIIPDDCDPNNCAGGVTVLATGGAGGLQYNWSDGATGTTRSGLCSGLYTVSVTDNNNCTVTRDVRILQPAGVIGTLDNVTDVTCNGGNDGSITVNASVDCGFTTGGCASPSTTQVGTGINANGSNTYPAPYGDFNNSVRHQMIFTASELNALGIQEGRITALDFDISLINGAQTYEDYTISMGCTGLNSITPADGFQSGLITVFEPKNIFISNGWNTHTFDNAFLWDGSSNVIVEWCFTNELVAGGNSANSTSQYTTTSFPSVIYKTDNLNSACGQTTIDGGSSNRPNVRFTHCGISYSYNWAPTPGAGQGTPTASGLSAGGYSVTVTSPDGCTDTVQATVNQPTPVVAAINIGQPISCNGVCDGEITASATGGDGNFTFTWATLSAGAVQTGLCTGNYQVIVTDGNGCADTANINLTEPAVLQANIALQAGISCNSVCDAQLLASATGGTGPYNFAWNSLPAGANQNNVCPGVYEVYVTDANGCADTAAITITEPPVLTINASETSAISCNGVCDGEAQATASGGTAPYTFSWSGGLSGANQTGLCAGTYDITVTDVNNCTEVTQITLNEPPAIQVNLAVDAAISCFGVCDGELSVNPSGGAAPYSVQWPSGNTGNTETGLCAGSVTVTVTDASSCSNTETVTLTEPTEIVITSNITQSISCNGDCDGEISVSAIGGAGGYTFNWATLPNGTTQSNLCAGTYTVTVTDAQGCQEVENITLNEPAPLVLSASIDQAILCGGTCNGQATASSTGGTGNVTYTWSGAGFGPVNGATQSGLCAGLYTIIGFDGNGCSDTITLSIGEPGILDLTLNQTQNIDCFGQCTGQVTATASGGVGPFNIQWPSGNTGTIESNLCAGTYNVTLTDANSCSTIESITITEPSVLTANEIISSPISCNGVCDGVASIIINGGTPGYTISWPSGATGATQTGLCVGNYDVTVTDNNGCSDTVQFTLTEPAAFTLSLSETSNITCNAACDGEITATATGGTAPITISWNSGLSNGAIQSGLCAGTYTATAISASGCIATDTLTLSQPAALSVATSVVDSISCNGICDGIVAASATGGNAPYNYTWSNGMNGDTLSGMCAGTYNVTLTDANNCQTTGQVTLTSPPVFDAIITATDSVSCFGGADGSATAGVNYISSLTCGPSSTNCTGPTSTIGVGTGGFTNGAQNFPSVYGAQQGSAHHQIIYTAAELSAAGLSAGTITEISFDILDTRGVSALEGFSISMGCTSNSLLTGNWLGGLTQVYSNPGVVFLTNGTNTHVLDTPYNWDGTSNLAIDVCFINAAGIGSNPEMAATLTTQPQVQFFADVIDVCANTAVNPATALQRPDISFTFCTDSNLPTSGTYSYAWSPAPAAGQTDSTAVNLSAGTYTVTVTDLTTGCTDTAVATIFEPSEVVGTVAVSSAVSCSGICDGELTASATGGTPGYTYSWSNGTTGAINSGLCAGSYTVTISDSNGCTDTVNFNLTEPISILVNTGVLNSIDCNGQCTGAIGVTYSGGVAPYTVAWNNGATQDTLTGLCAGQYVVTVTDDFGCNVTDTVTLAEPAALTTAINTVASITCAGSCDGSLSAVTTGGVAPYTFNWSNGAASDTLTGLCAGQYSVTITDANGCAQADTFNLQDGASINLNAGVTNASCNGICDGSIAVVPLTGLGPFSYAWSNGDTSNIINNLCAGSYTITVTDDNGCAGVDTFSVNEPSAILIDSVITIDPTCGLADGTIELSVSGGAGNYSFAWGNGASTNPVSGLTAGAYPVTITDINGCLDSTTIPLSNAGNPSINANAVDVACAGDCNGEVNVALPAGNFDIIWSTGNPADTTDTITGLCAGLYVVTVSDPANGCQAVDTTQIDEPPLLQINNMIVSNANCGQSNGEIEVFASGGVTPYNFIWNGNSTSNPATGLAPGTYNLELQDDNGCTVLDTVDVIDQGGIVADVQGVNIACFDSCNGSASATLTTVGTGPYSYDWSNGDTIQTINNLCDGNYQVTVTDDATGCTSIDSVTITQPSQIVIDSINVLDANCAQTDGEIEVFATGGSGALSYVWNGADTINPLTGIGAGLYALEVLDTNGCIVTANVPVTNLGGPQIAFTTSLAGCNGECIGEATAVISGGSGSYDIQWSNGDTSNLADSLCPGTYTVQVTDLSNGCITIDTAVINQATQVEVSFDITDNYNCSATTVCVGEVDPVLTGATGPFTYSWSNGSADSILTGVCADTFIVTVTAANGCVGTDTAIVEDIPSLAISDTITDASCSNTNNGSIDIVVTGGIPGYEYSWSGSNFSANTEDVVNLTPGNYFVTITDTAGCELIDTLAVGEETVLEVNAIDSNLCALVDSIWIGSTVNASAPVNYQWIDGLGQVLGDSSAIYVPVSSNSTSFIVVATSNNCTSTDTAVVSTGNIPDADAGLWTNIIAGETTPIGGDPTTSMGGSSYSWSPAVSLSDETVSNPNASPLTTTTYTVTVTNIFGCTNTDTVTIYVEEEIDVPSGFSPNGDGVNDGWELDILEEYPDATVQIFNRWGQLVFESQGYREPWDGRFEGEDLPVGTYYFVIDLNNDAVLNEPLTGPVTLMR